MLLTRARPRTPAAAAETRERLLEAAGEAFAAQGFRAATVRRICRRAGTGVAAVNDHFGGKRGLYAAVFEHALRACNERYPTDLGAGPGAPPEERLRAFVRSLLLRTLDAGRPAWHGQLMLREMADPTEALDVVVATSVRPMLDALGEIVRALIGPRATPREVRLFAFSVCGQCVYYRHCRAVTERLVPEQGYGPDEIEALADHVTRFSLDAIAAARAKGARRP